MQISVAVLHTNAYLRQMRNLIPNSYNSQVPKSNPDSYYTLQMMTEAEDGEERTICKRCTFLKASGKFIFYSQKPERWMVKMWHLYILRCYSATKKVKFCHLQESRVGRAKWDIANTCFVSCIKCRRWERAYTGPRRDEGAGGIVDEHAMWLYGSISESC